jgi:predicted ATP-grasp superfamily ATP-dependent carboligase
LVKNAVPFAIIASNVKDPIFLTTYAKHVVCIRKKKELDIADIFLCIESCATKFWDYDGFVLAPSTEALNRFFLEHLTIFEKELKVRVPLVNQDLYIQVSDKKAFGKLCADNNMAVPRELEIDEVYDFPIVAKPKQYLSANGYSYTPVIIDGVEDLKRFTLNFPVEDFYLQEFVGGESHYLLYYITKEGDVVKYSQQNLVQQSQGKSILAAIPSKLYQSSISDEYESLLKRVGFSGFVMIELKHSSNIYYMIEANPRFWGPFQLVVDCQTNLIETFLIEYGFDVTKKESVNPKAHYFWFGGIVQEIKKKNNLAYHNYTEESLLCNLKEWLGHDLYNRPDAARIFLKETTDD